MTTQSYAWLQSPAIQQLLHKLVDKLDAADARGSGTTQALTLTASTWPALYLAPLESDKEVLWEHVLELHRLGWLLVSPPLALKNSQGYDKHPKIKASDVNAIRTAVSRTHRKKTSNERWREAINAHLVGSDRVKQAAGAYCIDLADREMVDVVQQLNLLKALAQEPLMLREVSARLFWGMSKILDNRTGLVCAILEVEECPFPETPLQLQVYLPEGGFTGVLFIENQLSFERAIRSQSPTYAKLALVFASGFKGSAARLRKQDFVSLYFSSLGETGRNSVDYFESWLFGKNTLVDVFFWGDLDWSGLRILSAMKQNFPGIDAWQLGYQPMLEALLTGKGHTALETGKEGQQPTFLVGINYVDSHLIPALNSTQRFMDQERFLP